MMRGAVGRGSAWMGSAAARHDGMLPAVTINICTETRAPSALTKRIIATKPRKHIGYTTKRMKVKGETV